MPLPRSLGFAYVPQARHDWVASHCGGRTGTFWSAQRHLPYALRSSNLALAPRAGIGRNEQTIKRHQSRAARRNARWRKTPRTARGTLATRSPALGATSKPFRLRQSSRFYETALLLHLTDRNWNARSDAMKAIGKKPDFACHRDQSARCRCVGAASRKLFGFRDVSQRQHRPVTMRSAIIRSIWPATRIRDSVSGQ